MNRKSSKLERLPSSPSQFMTKTRSQLSFDPWTGSKEEETNVSETVPKPSSTVEGNRIARLSRKLFARPEVAEDEPKKEIQSANNIATASAGNRNSRNLFFSRSESSDSDKVRDSVDPGTPSTPNRFSRKFFAPQTINLMRSSSKTFNSSDSSQEEAEGYKVRSLRDSPDIRSSQEDWQLSPTTLQRFLPRRDEGSQGSQLSSERQLSDDSYKRVSRGFFAPRKSVSKLSIEAVDPNLMDRFQKVVLDRELREPLVEQLLASHSDGGSAKIRFVTAVNEYERTTNKNEKIAKGRKIMSVFIQRDGIFQLSGLRVEDQDSTSELDNLLLIRTGISAELISNPIIKSYLESLDDSLFRAAPPSSNES